MNCAVKAVLPTPEAPSMRTRKGSGPSGAKFVADDVVSPEDDCWSATPGDHGPSKEARLDDEVDW